jgi:enoyl-CoA hydratase
MNYKNLLIDRKENYAIVTVNRPSKLNALNKETIKELHNAFFTLDKDKQIKAIIVTGSGEKAFVAGADISEFANFNEFEGTELAKEGQKLLFNFIQNLATPVIAAINGFALGGGLELAMASHFRVASLNAKMGLPEVSLGVIPGYGGTQRLPQLVGKGKAMEMIMTAGMITAIEAKEWGLVNYVVELDQLLIFCEKIVSKIVRNSSTAIAAAIKSVNANFETGINGFNVEIEQFGKAFITHDFREGTTAFLEKRKPNFE